MYSSVFALCIKPICVEKRGKIFDGVYNLSVNQVTTPIIFYSVKSGWGNPKSFITTTLRRRL